MFSALEADARSLSLLQSADKDDVHFSDSNRSQLRLRQRVTKGPGSRTAGAAMAFKLIESAQTRWRADLNNLDASLEIRAGTMVSGAGTTDLASQPALKAGEWAARAVCVGISSNFVA
jgi:hypothetical protein